MTISEKLMLSLLSGRNDGGFRFLEIDNKYEIIIYWSKADGCFVAEIPELPGCMADGLTYIEVAENARIVIAEWIETAKSLGRPIPVPIGRLAYA